MMMPPPRQRRSQPARGQAPAAWNGQPTPEPGGSWNGAENGLETPPEGVTPPTPAAAMMKATEEPTPVPVRGGCLPMTGPEELLADAVADAAGAAFGALPKRGKPQEREWTVMAAVVAVEAGAAASALCVATGTKCLGHGKMSREGDVLNDAHAEVLARRCLRSFLLAEATQLSRDGGGGESAGRVLCRDAEGGSIFAIA